MLYYILQTIAFQLFFLLIYDVFLKKETFFNWNRAYLLITALGSLLLPFVKIEFFKGVVPEQFIIRLPEVIIGDVTSTTKNISLTEMPLNESSFVWHWEYMVYVGIILAAILFAYKMIKISLLIYKNPKRWKDNVLLVNLINSTSAFSFFHYICIGQLIKEEDKSAILKHEIVHVQQKHSLDLLFFEILRILFWFNPLVYIYQNKISTLHEYIADANAIKYNDKNQYYENLLSQVFDVKQFSFINPFFKQSLIKKRIVMLNKSKSKQVKLVKYALLIPIVFGILIYTSSAQVDNAKLDTSVLKEIPSEGSLLIEKISAVKKQIQKQGNVTDEEQENLNLLYKVVSGENFDADLVKKVQKLIDKKDKSELSQKVADVMDQIQKQGNISDDEEQKLKLLLLYTTEDGFNNPFFEDVIDLAEIPFGVIDEVPTFEECKQLATNKEKKDCTSTAIASHINKNFNTKLAKELNLKGKQRISVVFVIANDGTIKSAKARAPHPALEAEAIRVVESLPKMTPGKYNGKNVNVPYSLPIIFQVQ